MQDKRKISEINKNSQALSLKTKEIKPNFKSKSNTRSFSNEKSKSIKNKLIEYSFDESSGKDRKENTLGRNLLPEKDLKAGIDAMILIHDSSSISMKEKLNNKMSNSFYLDLFHENLSPIKKANNCASEKNKVKKIINSREGNKPEKINYFSSIDLRDLIEEAKIEEIMRQINKNLNHISLDEIIINIQSFFEICPIINNFSNTIPLLEKKDFDIYDNGNPEKFLFEINLYNLISLINLLWTITKKADSFNKYMNKLCLNFSFVKRKSNSRENEIDFVLLAPVSSKLYNYISTYGKTLFQNLSDLYDEAQKYINFCQKQQYDEGYFYEEYNSMNLLDEIGVKSCRINAKIIYYIKKGAAEKLINLEIITPPKIFSFPQSNIKEDGNKYEGYNELDLCITMLENIKIKEKENFRLVSLSDSLYDKDDDSKNDKDIEALNSMVLKKNVTYFFEFKLNIETMKTKLKKIKKVYNRFLEAFTNVEITQRIKLASEESKLILVCDKSISEVKEKINQDSDLQENNIIYSNPQVGMNLIFRLNDKIINLNNRMEKKDEEIVSINTQMKKKDEEILSIMKKKDEEINLLNNKISEINAKFEQIERRQKNKDYEIYDEIKTTLKHFSFIKPDLFITSIKNTKEIEENKYSYYESIYESFVHLSKYFLIIKEYEEKTLLYNDIQSFIGKKIEKEEEKSKWIKIKKEIFKKANDKNNNANIYYKGLFEFLFGMDAVDDDTIDNEILNEEKSVTKKYIKNLILFIEVLEYQEKQDAKAFEPKFQVIVFYIICSIGCSIILKKIFERETQINKIMTKAISCLNLKNFEKFSSSF